jgi:hypothetical protein
MVARLSGVRNGTLPGIDISIPARVKNSQGVEVDNMIRSAMVSTITELGGIDRYRIEDCGKSVPIDLHFGAGSTVWDVISELRDLYPGQEVHFDEESVFIFQPIPLYDNDPIVFDAETLAPLVISEDTNVDFGSIFNVTEVHGRSQDAEFYTDDVSMSGNLFRLNYSEAVIGLQHGMTFGFKASNNNVSGSRIQIDSFPPHSIIGEGNLPIVANRIEPGKSYVVTYVVSGNQSWFYFNGSYEICAVSKLVSKQPTPEKIAFDLLHEPTSVISYIINPESPFCSDFEDVGEIRKVYSGGEFDNIYSEDLCRQRSDYQNWRDTALLDTITLSIIDVPWLRVNQRIEYYSSNLGRTCIYLIKSKSGSTTDGKSTITCQRWQALYPWLRNTN